MPASLEVKGKTIGECLDDLIRQYPDARRWLFDRTGLLRVLVSVNNEETVTLNKTGLVRAVHGNDELKIFGVLGGG